MTQRRELLKGLLGLGTLLGMGSLGTVPIQDVQGGPMLMRVPIRGHRYHDGPRVMSLLSVGDELQLMREPHNLYDKDAVAVHAQDAHLGYIPREHNKVVASLLDQGTRLCTTLVHLDKDDDHAPCEVEVRLVI